VEALSWGYFFPTSHSKTLLAVWLAVPLTPLAILHFLEVPIFCNFAKHLSGNSMQFLERVGFKVLGLGFRVSGFRVRV
jgi:hypothetical protein